MKKRRLALIVAVMFTALAGLGFCLAIAAIVSLFCYGSTFERAAGRGGIGAVSAGTAELIVELLPLITVAQAALKGCHSTRSSTPPQIPLPG